MDPKTKLELEPKRWVIEVHVLGHDVNELSPMIYKQVNEKELILYERRHDEMSNAFYAATYDTSEAVERYVVLDRAMCIEVQCTFSQSHLTQRSENVGQ